MNLFSSKKSEVMMGIIVIILFILVFAGWLITIGQRECSSNAQCGSGHYCGSDHACHKMPTIERTVMSNNLVAPAVILGIAIIIAAIVLRYAPQKK